MASTPVFGSTPRFGSVQITDIDGTNVLDVANFAPPAAGTRVKEIRVSSGVVAPGNSRRIVIGVHDGTNVRLLESFVLANTADILQGIFPYVNFKLPFGHKLQVQLRAGLPTGGSVDVIVMGEDLT
jgi:hypothetical protein